MHPSRALAWLSLAAIPADLALARHREIRRQMPPLYASLGANALGLAYTHMDVAPSWLAIWMPVFLIAVSLLRLIEWARSSEEVEADDAWRLLRRTVLLGSLLAAGFTLWSMGLSSYGSDCLHAHVSLFIALTVVACVFCLLHLPEAAIPVVAITIIPYLVLYLTSDDDVYVAVGVNLLIVGVVIIRMIVNHAAGFEKLVRITAETLRLNREVTSLAHLDVLTGLPNRRDFFQRLEGEIRRCRADGGDLAVGLIDLDRFKSADDLFGHATGDLLPGAVGERLRAVFGPERILARLGGGEFAFVLRAREGDAHALATKACTTLGQPFRIGELVVSIGASCGLVRTPDVALDAFALYDSADYAL